MRKSIAQETKPYEWVYIETGLLRDSSAPISLKRIDQVPSNCTTSYPSIWTMYNRGQITFWGSHPTPFWGPVSGIQRYTMISPILHVEISYLPEQGCTVSQILHQCSQECAKCIQYMLCIGRRSRYVVSNRENGYLAKSECLSKRHSLKPADLEMVEALNVLTPRHQHKQTLLPGTQEYVKYIYCKE